MISEFPLFVFTTLAGLAAGAYAVAAFVPPAALRAGRRPWLFPLVAIALLGVGLLGVLGHLGRPLRFLNALANPSAMISQEAYWSIAFGVLLLIDLVLAFRAKPCPRAVSVLAGVAAAGLIAVMTIAYCTSYGNPVWAAWPTVGLYAAGDAAMGAALCTLFADGARRRTLGVAASVLAACAAAAFAAEGAHFLANGLGAGPFWAAVALAVLAAAVQAAVSVGKAPATAGVAVAFALALAAVAVARYAFYAASIL